MREDPVSPEPPALAAGTAGGSTLTPVDGPLTLRAPVQPLKLRRRRLPPLRMTLGATSGKVAIALLILGTLAIVLTAAGSASNLVPRAWQVFPGWEAGPLHVISGHVSSNPRLIGYAFSGVLLVMILAYLAALGSVRALPLRLIVIAVVVLHVILLLSPPMQLSDLFNYLGYARLGALHGLNPYGNTIRQEMFDPVYLFSSWHNLRSPYGPLFTALTYPLSLLSLPIAYWVLKLVTVAMSLAFVALVWQCARQLGRDPRLPVAFVALNPIFLIYEIGAFHNDFFMLVPMLGAISLILARRDRSAGAVLMLAVAIKFTAVVLLPFLLVAAVTRERRVRVLVGAAAAAVVIGVMWVALFGLTIPNLSQQSTLLTGTSIPNVIGLVLHVGGATPLLLKVFAVGVVLVVAHQFYRNRDWVAGAGWATFALIASLGWLMPWYVVWLLPLAGLVRGPRLRTVAVALTIYLILAFMPWTAYYMADNNINLLNTAAGASSTSLQNKLSQ